MSDLVPPTRYTSRPVIDSVQAISDKDINRAAVELGTWYMSPRKSRAVSVRDEEENHTIDLHRAGATFQAYGADLVKIRELFSQLDSYERETLDDLRDTGVSIPDVVDYLRAPVDLNPEGHVIRSDMASRLRLREFQAHSEKMQSSGRSAAILAGSAIILVAGAALAAPMVLSALSPALATTFTTALAPVAAYLPLVQKTAFGLMNVAAGGGAVAVAIKSWNNWQKIKGGPPALDIGSHSDFSDLPNSLGSINYKIMTDEYQAIPSADRYLLSHLSKSEMRMFLCGSDSVRKHILSASPPSAWAKIQSRLDTVAQGKKTLPARARRLSRALGTIMTASWNRQMGNGRIPDLEKRMETWRAAAEINRRSRQEDLGLHTPAPVFSSSVHSLAPAREPVSPRAVVRVGCFTAELPPPTRPQTPPKPGQ